MDWTDPPFPNGCSNFAVHKRAAARVNGRSTLTVTAPTPVQRLGGIRWARSVSKKWQST